MDLYNWTAYKYAEQGRNLTEEFERNIGFELETTNVTEIKKTYYKANHNTHEDYARFINYKR